MMAGWNWLTKPQKAYGWGFIVRVIAKTVVLFLLINGCYLITNPLAWLSQLTLYNTAYPSRERLPYADNPDDTYSISLQKIEGLFASHELATNDKRDDEFRVVMLGDSGVWGWLLEDDETFAACLNQGNYQTADGRFLRVYNLGYPVTSVTKDVLLMQAALEYDVDGVVWMVTLQAMYQDEQLRHPILQSNADKTRDLVNDYDLGLDTASLPSEPTLWERSLIGQRRELADLLRYQIYGFAWSVTSIDHQNPKFFRAPPYNLLPGIDIPTRGYITPVLQPQSQLFDGLSLPQTLTWHLSPEFLAWDVLETGVEIAQAESASVLIVNEPIFISTGQNGIVEGKDNRERRYNDLYPVWAYDSYRAQLNDLATAHNWAYQDLWNAVPADQFTDYPLHFTAPEVCRIAALLAPEILKLADN